MLVSQDQAQIEHYRRQAEGGWSYHLHAGLQTSVDLPSIRCVLKLEDVYDRVVFPPSDDV